jgi:Flp pilus assembly protein TadG
MGPAAQCTPRRIAQVGARLCSRCRELRDERGSSLVELALIVAFFATPLLLGTADVGILVYYSIEVTNAAAAGATYAMQSSTYSADTTGITSAARAEAADLSGTTLSVTPSVFYVCSTAVTGTRYTGTSAQSNATSACIGGTNHALQFVQVTTSASVSPLVQIAGLPTTFTLAGGCTMEVEQ